MGAMSFTERLLSLSETVLPVVMLYLAGSDIRPITNESTISPVWTHTDLVENH